MENEQDSLSGALRSHVTTPLPSGALVRENERRPHLEPAMSRLLKVGSQVAGFVRQDSQAFLAAWISYRIEDRDLTMAVVFKARRNLFPRDTIGHGYKNHQRGISRDEFRGWLESNGYEILNLVADHG